MSFPTRCSMRKESTNNQQTIWMNQHVLLSNAQFLSNNGTNEVPSLSVSITTPAYIHTYKEGILSITNLGYHNPSFNCLAIDTIGGYIAWKSSPPSVKHTRPQSVQVYAKAIPPSFQIVCNSRKYFPFPHHKEIHIHTAHSALSIAHPGHSNRHHHGSKSRALTTQWRIRHFLWHPGQTKMRWVPRD
jgi:hypothetical protein